MRGFSVRVSWRRSPSDVAVETFAYALDLRADYEGWRQLGGEPPLIQIAKEVKKMREELTRLRAHMR